MRMFCNKCGAQLENDVKFQSPARDETPVETPPPAKKKKKTGLRVRWR